MGTNIIAYGCLMALLGCSDQAPSNTPKEYVLSDGASKQSLVMPAGLQVQQPTPSLLLFRVRYPGMQGLDPQQALQGDGIAIWLKLADQIGRTESLVKQAAEKIDPARPGQSYHDGKQGAFEIYRGMLDSATSVPHSVTYVFVAEDGQLVGVEDPGGWSHAYAGHRKIGAKIHVQYLIAKPLGRDFIEMDKAVKDFIVKLARASPEQGPSPSGDAKIPAPH